MGTFDALSAFSVHESTLQKHPVLLTGTVTGLFPAGVLQQ